MGAWADLSFIPWGTVKPPSHGWGSRGGDKGSRPRSRTKVVSLSLRREAPGGTAPCSSGRTDKGRAPKCRAPTTIRLCHGASRASSCRRHVRRDSRAVTGSGPAATSPLRVQLRTPVMTCVSRRSSGSEAARRHAWRVVCAAGCSVTRVGGEGPFSRRGPQFLYLCQEHAALHPVEGCVAPQAESRDTSGSGPRLPPTRCRFLCAC